ncbi:MAG: protein-export chaperone SecB [Lysobacteraceae bacterium]
MADENSNGAAGANTAQPQGQAQFNVQKIYVRDVSFEAPNVPQSFNEQAQPQLSLNLNQKVNRVADEVYEVVLTLTLDCKVEDRTIYLVEVQQAGLFTLTGFDERTLDMMLGSYCPNILFPYGRQMISELIQAGGFPPFLLQPINFDQLYADQLRRRAEQGQQSAGGETTPPAGNA